MERLIINAVGDSIVKGFGVEKSFVEVDGTGFVINNFGINGDTSENVLYRIEDYKNCDILLLYYGLNDFLNGCSVWQVVDNSKKIIEKVNTEIILCIPHKVDVQELAFIFNPEGINRKLSKLIEEYKLLSNVKILNFYELFADETDLFDGIHPTDKMQKQMQQYLLDFLEVEYGIS